MVEIKKALAFEQSLYQLINNSGLSVDVAYFVLKSVYMDFQKTVYNIASSPEEKHEEVTENERNFTANTGSNDDN